MADATQSKKLPANARCVFNGVIFEVWQWNQKMFDGSVQIFEKIWRAPTVEILATVGEKILIQEQDQPDRKNFISLPGGRADQNKEPLIEAKRELLEETGYHSDDWLFAFRHGGDGKVLHEMYYFVARNCKKIQEPELDAGEIIANTLISFEELLQLSNEARFWVSPEFKNRLLSAQYDPIKSDELKKMIFG